LSPLGRDVVAECNRLGLVIDASHAAKTTTRQLIELSQTPILLTHSGCAAVHQHPRNVSDDVLRELAARGGVIQVNTVWSFLVPEPKDRTTADINAAKKQLMAKYAGRALTDEEVAVVSIENRKIGQRFRPQPVATLDDYLKHLFHAIDVAGVDHVGIGSDMDGGGGVGGLEDVAQYPKITRALLQHGLSESDVEKIWGGNTLRVLRAAEEFAAK
jgi:membrane dipeptidase